MRVYEVYLPNSEDECIWIKTDKEIKLTDTSDLWGLHEIDVDPNSAGIDLEV